MDCDDQGRGEQEEDVDDQFLRIRMAEDLFGRFLLGAQEGCIEDQRGHDEGRVDAQAADARGGRTMNLAWKRWLYPASTACQGDHPKGKQVGEQESDAAAHRENNDAERDGE